MRRPRWLGPYRLLYRISTGGMAEIFRAVVTAADGSEHQVAIKRLLPAFTADEQFVVMLVDEARITAHFAHPNIARTYEFGVVEDEYFLAMEFIDGVDLRSAVLRSRERDTLVPPIAASYVLEMALRGLHHAHEQHGEDGHPLGIIHRDISPSNILLSWDGEVKLIDFGIAKDRMSRAITRHGVIKGKLKYMSPEQTHGKKLDRRSDVFSAGAVLYHTLTGHSPFHAPDDASLMLAVREQQPDPPSHTAAVDEALDGLDARALAKDPGARYQTAEAFAHALSSWRRSVYGDEEPQERLTRLLSRIFARERREAEERFGEFDLSFVPDDENTANRQYTRLVDVGHFTGSREVWDPRAQVDRWLASRRGKTDGGAERDTGEEFWSPDSRPHWVDETRRTLEMEAVVPEPVTAEIETDLVEAEDTGS